MGSCPDTDIDPLILLLIKSKEAGVTQAFNLNMIFHIFHFEMKNTKPSVNQDKLSSST